MTEVRVPTLGESVTEATVATWFKKPGDAVAQDEQQVGLTCVTVGEGGRGVPHEK